MRCCCQESSLPLLLVVLLFCVTLLRQLPDVLVLVAEVTREKDLRARGMTRRVDKGGWEQYLSASLKDLSVGMQKDQGDGKWRCWGERLKVDDKWLAVMEANDRLCTGGLCCGRGLA